MKKSDIDLRTTDSILGELNRVQQAVRERAYELFENNAGRDGGPLSDWLTAEQEIIRRPPVEVHRRDSHYEVRAATAGVPAENLNVQVTPDDVLIEATAEDRELFGSVHFPEKIDPNSVRVKYKDGMLHLTATIMMPRAVSAEQRP